MPAEGKGGGEGKCFLIAHDVDIGGVGGNITAACCLLEANFANFQILRDEKCSFWASYVPSRE